MATAVAEAVGPRRGGPVHNQRAKKKSGGLLRPPAPGRPKNRPSAAPPGTPLFPYRIAHNRQKIGRVGKIAKKSQKSATCRLCRGLLAVPGAVPLLVPLRLGLWLQLGRWCGPRLGTLNKCKTEQQSHSFRPCLGPRLQTEQHSMLFGHFLNMTLRLAPGLLPAGRPHRRFQFGLSCFCATVSQKRDHEPKLQSGAGPAPDPWRSSR